jgi:hypothetical protein
MIAKSGPALRYGRPYYRAVIANHTQADLLDQMAYWCADQFGMTGPWFDTGDSFYFNKEEDLFLFALRWS